MKNDRRVSKMIVLLTKLFNNFDEFQKGDTAISLDGEDACPGERVRQEMIPEVPASSYKGRGQAGANREQRDKGTMDGLGKAGIFGDRERGTAVTSRTMFNTPRQFPIREI